MSDVDIENLARDYARSRRAASIAFLVGAALVLAAATPILARLGGL